MARDRSRVFAARANEPNSATRVKTRMPCSWSMGEHCTDDCQAGPDNEFGFVRFFEPVPSGKLHPTAGAKSMFAFDRSALAVLAPLALLLAVVIFSNRSTDRPPQAEAH